MAPIKALLKYFSSEAILLNLGTWEGYELWSGIDMVSENCAAKVSNMGINIYRGVFSGPIAAKDLNASLKRHKNPVSEPRNLECIALARRL